MSPDTSIAPEILWNQLEFGKCTFTEGLLKTWNPICEKWGFFTPVLRSRSIDEAFAPIVNSRADLKKIIQSIEAISTGGIPDRTIELELKTLGSQNEKFQVCLFAADESDTVEMILRPLGQGDALSRIYQRVFDSTPEGIMILDASRVVRLVNRACGDLLGRDPREVVENNCVCGEMVNCHKADGQSLNSQLCPAKSLFTDGGKPQNEVMLVTNSAGEERWVETTYSPMLDARGNVEFVIGLIRDVHEQKLLEERLRQSEKLASLGQLTAGIAHEIKNPLGIILSSVEIILDGKRSRDMQVEAASFIRDEVKRLDERIREFLLFARPNTPHREFMKINPFLEKFIQDREPHDEDRHTGLILDPNADSIFCDEDHLAQILTNLYINVFEASRDKARIIIRTKRKGSDVVIEMHDNGPGVPAELWDRVFNPFFTTDANGTGLGLSIIAQLANANGGTVTVRDSDLLEGAEFVVRLPIGRR